MGCDEAALMCMWNWGVDGHLPIIALKQQLVTDNIDMDCFNNSVLV